MRARAFSALLRRFRSADNKKKSIRKAPRRPLLEEFEDRIVPTAYIWAGASGGDREVAANWTPNTGFPNAATDTATIAAAFTGTINVTATDTINSLTFNNTSTATPVVIAGAGRWRSGERIPRSRRV